jgi:hypothetical protein
MHTIDKAFIRAKDGIPDSTGAYTIWQGAKECGIEVSFFTKLDEILSEVTPYTLVCSGVGEVTRALAHLPHSRTPDFQTYPKCLKPFLGRDPREGLLSEIRSEKAWPLFVKPVEHKRFTGHVVQEFFDLVKTSHLGDDTPVYISETVQFLTEYRCYIHWDKVVGIYNYAGDITIFPDLEVLHNAMQQMLRRYPGLPISYSLDLGVLEGGRTVVVETNDSFSLGNYGLPWTKYTPMVIDRWLELSAEPNEFARDLVFRFLDKLITEEQFINRFVPAVDFEHYDIVVNSAHLIWCEYTSCEGATEEWLYLTLKSVIDPLRLKFGTPR